MKRRNADNQPTLFASQPQHKLPAVPTANDQVSPGVSPIKAPAWMNGTKNPIVSWLKSSTPRLPAYTQLAEVITRDGKPAGKAQASPTTEGSAMLAKQLAQDFTSDQRLSTEEIGALIGDLQQAASDAAQLLMLAHPKEK